MDFKEQPDGLSAAGRALGFAFMQDSKTEGREMFFGPERLEATSICSWSLFPLRFRGHQGGLPRIQDCLGLRISYVTGIRLVDYIKRQGVPVSFKGGNSRAQRRNSFTSQVII